MTAVEQSPNSTPFVDTEKTKPISSTSYTINPCIDSVWKINTTVQIGIEVTDGDTLSQWNLN